MCNTLLRLSNEQIAGRLEENMHSSSSLPDQAITRPDFLLIDTIWEDTSVCLLKMIKKYEFQSFRRLH